MEKENEKRTFSAELRLAGDKRKICGYAAKFNSQSRDLGGFTETITPGAFRDTLKRDLEADPIMAFWNHNTSKPLGSTRNGTLTLKEDDTGLWFECLPPKTSWSKDVREAISSGLIAGCSFGFNIEKDEWRDSGSKRELQKINLHEISPVSMPAYPETEVNVREMKRRNTMDKIQKVEQAAKDLMKAVDYKEERAQLPFLMDMYDKRAVAVGWPTIEERGFDYILEFFRTDGDSDPAEDNRLRAAMGKPSREEEVSGPLTLRMDPQDTAGNGYENRGGSYHTPENANVNTHNRSFRGMFYPRETSITLDNGGFKSALEFLNVLESGRFDPRLQERAAMVEGIPSSGGFSTPPQFVSDWLDASLPQEIVRNRCRVYPMESSEITVAGFDASDMSSGSLYGGLKMQFLAESAEGDKQTAKMRKITMAARTGAIYVDASLELAEDGRGFAEQLQSALIKSIGYGIDSHCISGSGAGNPLGIRNAGCKVQVAAESGQAEGSIIYANLKKMFARQLNPSNAVWLFNPTAIPSLLETTIAIGTGGSHVEIFKESNGEFTLFGRPCLFTPHMPAVGSADDCAFVDFSFYALGLRKDIGIDITDAHRWTQRERSYRVLIRWDAQPLLDAAVTPENGDTLSPIVTLAER